jgi:redox-sensitive bicupin YhaK (pirin superfamily)
MLSSANAIIYLNERRGCSESGIVRSFHTFNFGHYFREERKSFGNLFGFNDDTLKEGSTLQFEVKENAKIILLPLVGALNYRTGSDQGILDAGEVRVLFPEKGSLLEITNPYENDLINFLHIWIRNEADEDVKTGLSSLFDLDKNKNKLISLVSSGHSVAYIGKFEGRNEATVALKNPPKGIFVFIIEGAFEVQNRLLQHRDGLAVWGASELEFEALSNNAILLLIEP